MTVSGNTAPGAPSPQDLAASLREEISIRIADLAVLKAFAAGVSGECDAMVLQVVRHLEQALLRRLDQAAANGLLGEVT